MADTSVKFEIMVRYDNTGRFFGIRIPAMGIDSTMAEDVVPEFLGTVTNPEERKLAEFIFEQARSVPGKWVEGSTEPIEPGQAIIGT